MAINPFIFKQFTINQERAAMKVGTDGVLLGAWADVERARCLLDIGTGTGLVALMVAQRNSQAAIDAIEPEEQAYLDACDNVAASPWRERVSVHNVAVQQFKPYDHRLYDHILCNPPFFEDSLRSPNLLRSVARHSDTLNFDELIACSRALMTDDGRLSVIIPSDRKSDFLCSAGAQLHLSRITEVVTRVDSEPKRLLIELTAQLQGPPVRDRLMIRDADGYSEQYRMLTADFYLAF